VKIRSYEWAELAQDGAQLRTQQFTGYLAPTISDKFMTISATITSQNLFCSIQLVK
jgi:hypothetical protein